MVFSLLHTGTCRTIEMLDRNIGQRRDATRAPIQARNGWRPSGRLLVSPPLHLRTAEFLFKRWGPPQQEPNVGNRGELFEQAKNWFLQSLKLNPNDQFPHYRLGQLLA